MTIAAVIIMLLVSACGGAGGGSQPTATFGPAVQTRLAEAQRPRATSTPTPETAARAATATSTPRQETPTPRPSAPELAKPEPGPATEALLLALLSLDDLPEGWQGGEAVIEDQNTSGWTGDDDMFAQPSQQDECGYDYDDPNLSEVSAYFERNEEELLVLHQVSLYASDQSAEMLLSQLFAAIARCPEIEETFDDRSVSVTRVDVLEVPQIGDQSGTFQITTSDDDFNFAIAITGFRVGRVVSFIFQFDSLDLAGPAESWELHSLATLAADKINALRETFDALETPAENVV
jgi:hypothetical protein